MRLNPTRNYPPIPCQLRRRPMVGMAVIRGSLALRRIRNQAYLKQSPRSLRQGPHRVASPPQAPRKSPGREHRMRSSPVPNPQQPRSGPTPARRPMPAGPVAPQQAWPPLPPCDTRSPSPPPPSGEGRRSRPAPPAPPAAPPRLPPPRGPHAGGLEPAPPLPNRAPPSGLPRSPTLIASRPNLEIDMGPGHG